MREPDLGVLGFGLFGVVFSLFVCTHNFGSSEIFLIVSTCEEQAQAIRKKLKSLYMVKNLANKLHVNK